MKMKRIPALLLALAMLLVCLTGCGDNANKASDDQVFNLKIDYPNPENSAIYPVLVKWGEWLDEQSGGRIKVKVYSGGALGSISDCVTNCESGVTDGFWSAMNLYPGAFPLCDIFPLPMMGAANFDSMNAAMQDFIKKDEFQQQFEKVHLVSMHSSTASSFIFGEEVDSIQGMQGKTVRSHNTNATPWLTKLGATPISVSANDAYESIQKHVVDGGIWFLDQVQSSALYEIIGSYYYGEMCYPCLALFINADLYNSMPEDLQKLIDDSDAYYQSLLDEAYYTQEEEILAILDEYNVKRIPETAESRAWLASEADAAYQQFAESVDALGYDGMALIQEFQALTAHYNEVYSN